MWEESFPSILASVFSWFTPAVLFLLLNLVIGTIAVASKVGAGSRAAAAPMQPSSGDAEGRHHQFGATDAKFLRSPSSIFNRLRSFDFQRYRSPEAPAPTEAVAASPVHRAEILENRFVPASGGEAAAAAAAEEEEEHFKPLGRSQSDAQPTAGEAPPKLAVRIKKSASDNSAFAHFEEAEIVETPLPAEAAAAAAAADSTGGDEVDARADDFINRFRQQLKLQRLESIMRYREMINRAR